MAPTVQRISGWDPVLLISQIVTLQTLHYLTLSIITPPILYLFANRDTLLHEGGAWSVGMVMDWREMAGRTTFEHQRGWTPFEDPLNPGASKLTEPNTDPFKVVDPIRGWIIAACWLVASFVDVYYIYTFVRRPKMVLDFSLTLVMIHLVMTTYYSAALPSSLFFWLILAGGAAIKIIFGEQMCVKREMREGLDISGLEEERALRDEHLEMGALRRD
ncbi:hypothetical protein SISNIDRAFT_473800 [Sistotremastrum niveocremeum HHB9708]|uniref:Integral membrane protein n=1 Tax=Sistotremastrum niveocremeum HHB9708 TaxID=1314777 RepID=A0A164W5L7_9AGAM|nr:hypothetical protein SISNIDRAFT_473800 [Sistotremastrum niveocremeum HHB9708]